MKQEECGIDEIKMFMKILFIRRLNPFFDASASGNRFASLVDGLARLGVQITILVTGGYNNFAERRSCAKSFDKDNIRVRYLIPTSNHTIWWRRFNKYVLYFVGRGYIKYRLRKDLCSFDGNFVWLTNDALILSSYITVSDKLKCRTLLEINEFHDIYKLDGKITHKFQIQQAKESEGIYLEAIKHIDCFAIMTKTLLNYYKSMVKPEAVLMHLPMTVDMSRFEMDKDKNCKECYIAFAGSFDNSKDGLRILIESFAKLYLRYPKYKLKIAGFYHPDVEQQKQLIEKYGIQDKVQYVGVLTREQIPYFLKNASILALARPDSHQARGGFPTKLGEYLSTKNPVCVTNVGEIGYYLKDNESAFLAFPNSVDSFTDALERALQDEELAKKVGLEGYEVAKANFNMEIQSKRLYTFLCDNLKK